MTDCFGIEVSVEEIERWSRRSLELVQSWATKPHDPGSSQWDRAADHLFKYHLPIEDTDLSGKVVLELGCGFGRNAAILRPYEYYGLDISTAALARAEYDFSRWTHHVTFWHTVYHPLVERTIREYVDLVFGKYFFNHQPPDRMVKMFEFSHRVLRGGGQIVIDRSRDHAGLRPPEGEWTPGEEWTGFVQPREWYEAELRRIGFGCIKFIESELFVKRVGRNDVLELVVATKE